MIKFFRHIRQRLISDPPERNGSVREGKRFSKYLLYAIGEIILVVIGILIALQISNWNDKQKLQAYEEKLLSQLQQDLVLNAKDLELNISLQKRTIQSIDILLEHFESNEPYADSLEVHFSNSALWTKFIVNAGAYKTIEAKGLDFISDVELRDLVFRIYEGNLNWLQQMEEIVINHTENFRQNYASKYFAEWNSVEIDNGNYVEGKTSLRDYELFLGDEGAAYRYFLSATKGEVEVLLDISEGFLDDNRQGIELIKNILSDTKDD
ncbi:MAG: hypothetical protein CMC15_07825 [Flavobacteriaceae bacterium]|nr:hypothetical protein [Flavobacteriaceae bacterium]MAY52435.1 hypothetical protein [Flavobacteriaceae bacterium]|tara:strand:- start:38606 stop:39403 length:798 start_codon:yes stop_codon:yes gene_type:complete